MATATINDFITTGKMLGRSRSYNGFDWDARIATNKPQRILRRQLGEPTTCCITGFSRPHDLKGSGYVFLHLEDYRNVRDWYPVSKRTHARMHARFTDPRSWFDLVYDHYEHGAWFTMLVMSPTKVLGNWGFDRIYPRGLPKDGEFWASYATACGLEREMFRDRDLRVPIRALWSFPTPPELAQSPIQPRARRRA